MLAVLADAIYTFRRTAGATRGKDRRLFAETAGWFAESSTARPFAFAWICDALGLDPAFVRRALRGGGPRRAPTRAACGRRPS